MTVQIANSMLNCFGFRNLTWPLHHEAKLGRRRAFEKKMAILGLSSGCGEEPDDNT
jgi:hypothetical protein